MNYVILCGDVIAKLAEIRDKRTHCQCSRAKVVEKKEFDLLIAKISRFGVTFDRETAAERLKTEADSIPVRNDDMRIKKTAYMYAIEVIKRADDVEIG